MNILSTPKEILCKFASAYRYWQCLRLTCKNIYDALGDYENNRGVCIYHIDNTTVSRCQYICSIIECCSKKHLYFTAELGVGARATFGHLHFTNEHVPTATMVYEISIYNKKGVMCAAVWSSGLCARMRLGRIKFYPDLQLCDFVGTLYYIYKHYPELYQHIELL